MAGPSAVDNKKLHSVDSATFFFSRVPLATTEILQGKDNLLWGIKHSMPELSSH